MSIGGWKTRGVFSCYAIVDESDVVAAMGKLEAKNGASSVYSEDDVARK